MIHNLKENCVILLKKWKAGDLMGMETSVSAMRFGKLKKGERNLITDAPGVKVGHFTLHEEESHTGITCIIPGRGDVFHYKCLAASHVINGFGKSAGLVQVDELGTLETPILLTNTLAVGDAMTGLVKHMLDSHADIGRTTSTINPIVMECNDGFLSDIRAMAVTKEMVPEALAKVVGGSFEEGGVGAGTGMCCYSLKGGIGSASRILPLNGKEYVLGTLVLSNFGILEDLVIQGNPVGDQLFQHYQQSDAADPKNKISSDRNDRGSVIVVIATNAPFTTRQLKRLAKRAQSGLAKTGCISGNGSGEIVLAFSNAIRIPHYRQAEPFKITFDYIAEDDLDIAFRSVIDCVEESVISSLFHAESLTGLDGHHVFSLPDALEHFGVN